MLKTFIKYKELIYFLVHKDLRVKYRNSFFGFFWTLLEPLGMMAIYTIVFSIIIRFKVDNYPLFILSGLIPWMYLSNSLRKGAKSLTVNASLIKKIYFPRQIFPIATVLTNFIHFIPALSLVMLLAVFTEGGAVPFARMLILPAIILLQTLLVLSIALVLSVMNVYYKDVEIILAVVLRGWMYLSPIIYPLSFVPEEYVHWYLFNPMAVILSLYRWVFFPDMTLPAAYIICTAVLTVVAFMVTWKLFDRISRRVGEVI